MFRLIAGVALCTLAVLGAACSDDSDGGSTGADNDRDAFVQDVEDRISDLRAELGEMRDDIANGNAGKEIDEQAEALEARINDAESELDQARNASDDEWEALKQSVEEALRDAGELAEEIGNELGLN